MILFIIGGRMKKGFTLIEVLAILVILSVIGAIVVPTINKSINDSKQKAYDSQVEIIIAAAKKWAISNNEMLPIDGNVYKLSLVTLISEQYITNSENGKLKNPKDSKDYMDGCVYISYSETYNQYLYEYREDC